MLKVCENVDVVPLLAELHTHKELWNTIPARTENEKSPHHGADDIPVAGWGRYIPLWIYNVRPSSHLERRRTALLADGVFARS